MSLRWATPVGDPSRERPTRRWRAPVRRRALDDLAALSVLSLMYLGIAYAALPAWWRQHYRHGALAADRQLTRTAQGIPADPVNLELIGTEAQVVDALVAAGWKPADPTTLRTSLRITGSVLLRRPYPTAPVSNLYLFGRKQDLAFQQAAGDNARRRHHARFWRSEDAAPDGRPVWLGAATFDCSVGLSHRTGQVTHHVAADIDHERDKLADDLWNARCAGASYAAVGLGPGYRGHNGGGDPYYTDGMVRVMVLLPVVPAATLAGP